MKIVSLSEQEAAITGYNFVAHLKGANGDLDTAETINIIPVSVAGVVSNTVVDVVTSLGGTFGLGIGNSVTSATTFFSAVTMTAAGTYVSATISAKNLTASQFLTATAGTGSATGEAFLWFRYNDHTRLRNAVTA